MLIDRIEVNGIDSSLMASGYPKQKDDISFDRGARLGKCKPGTGHDCYLKGITVTADITAAQYWWLQFQRYHFADIVSSESKMHCLTEMDIDYQCNAYVYEEVIELVEELVRDYKDNPTRHNFQTLIANVPMGLVLKARIVTNYLQLKTIYLQRKNHKLEEWQTFCKWLDGLPLFKTLIGEKVIN